jgi:glycosyltransferase involved in cell wall biosynthesis
VRVTPSDSANHIPTVSIVVPALNEARLIGDCLDSLAQQDYPGPLDVIVVDNGSTDATAEVARDLGARVFVEDRRGVCYARQLGTAAAGGDIVVSTDADTVFARDWVSRIVAAFARGGDGLVAVCGPCRYVDAPFWVRPYNAALFGVVTLYYRLTGRVCYATATNIAFRRTAWHGYQVELSQGADELGLLHSLRTSGRVHFEQGNATFTSSRRLYRGLLYSLFVTCLWYYLIAYNVNRIAGRRVVGNAPVLRPDDRPARRTRRILRAMVTVAAIVVGLAVFRIVRADVDVGFA